MDLNSYPGIDPRASNDWRRIPARKVDKWYVGLDVGQSIDPSALCVLNHIVDPLDDWTPSQKAQTWKQKKTERFYVRHLERLPLQQPYPDQIEHVRNLLARAPLRGATFALDFTGVGRPVGDMFYAAGLRPVFVLITAGNETTRHGSDQWNVPKSFLISNIESRLHSGELRIASELTDAPALRDELKDFARKVSDTGRVTYNARSGAHDDLVLALGITLFAALNRTVSGIDPLPF
jgi:hypothetical protein